MDMIWKIIIFCSIIYFKRYMCQLKTCNGKDCEKDSSISSLDCTSNRTTCVTCNTSQKKTYILNGKTVVSCTCYPFVVALFDGVDGELICGGSLIHPQWVLTAAHCIDSLTGVSTDINVGAGCTNVDRMDIKVSVNATYIHPNYNPQGLQHDLALLNLSTPLQTSLTLNTIDLTDDFCEGTSVTLIGWGPTQPNGSRTADLKCGDSEVSEVCARYLKTINRRGGFDLQYQVGVLGEAGSLNSDSGGPGIVTCKDGSPKLLGVMSGSSKKHPECTGLTRPIPHLPWIEEITGLCF